MNWFDVDKQGLAKLLEQRGKTFALLELIQNAWDQQITRVDVTVTPVMGRPYVRVTVEDDDPIGFADLTHAFTLFAESAKKIDPEKRGRFNLGEKLVLACCSSASIASTTGTVIFDASGRRQRSVKRSTGSLFTGVMRMTREELDESLRVARTIIPPVQTYLNGELIPRRVPVATWEATLPTEVADEQGYLRRRQRKTMVTAYEPLPGETATLYELGIPVVETGDRWHVSIGQKAPVSLDRTNVPPSYLRSVRVGVFNAMAHQLTAREASQPWVRDAAGHPDAQPEAVTRVMDLRFGEKRVAYDPSDAEANRIAASKGFTVVTGGSLSAGEWANVRGAAAILPAGRVTPSPKPFHPDGESLRMVTEPTDAMQAFRVYARRLAQRLLGIDLVVKLADDSGWNSEACFGRGELTVNVASFGGQQFFANGPDEALHALLIHEFAHHYEGNHLSGAYYEACCRLGAALTRLALTEPAFVRDALPAATLAG